MTPKKANISGLFKNFIQNLIKFCNLTRHRNTKKRSRSADEMNVQTPKKRGREPKVKSALVKDVF